MRVIAVLAALLLLGGCGSDAQVAALRADPMGDWSRPGLQQTRESVSEPGTSLGKPRYAGLHRILEVQDGTDVTAVLAEVRAAADGAGWSVTYEQRSGAFTAQKVLTVDGERLRGRLSAGRQDLGGSSGRDGDLPGARRVPGVIQQISLVDKGIGPVECR